MSEQRSRRRTALLSGLTTTVCLVGPIILMIILASVLERLPLLTQNDLEPVAIGFMIALGLVAGGFWGWRLARLANIGYRWRMLVAGTLSLAPAVAFDVWLLITLDNQYHVFRTTGFEGLPEHVQYMLIFVTSAFFVATWGALLLSFVAINIRAAARNAILTGLGAAISYLLVTLGMDLIGYRIGSGSIHAGLLPDVPAMPAVTLVAMVLSSLVGGAVLGWLLNTESEQVSAAAPAAAQSTQTV